MAVSTITFLTSYSFSMDKLGLPTGCGIAIALTILLAPTFSDIGVTVQI